MITDSDLDAVLPMLEMTKDNLLKSNWSLQKKLKAAQDENEKLKKQIKELRK